MSDRVGLSPVSNPPHAKLGVIECRECVVFVECQRNGRAFTLDLQEMPFFGCQFKPVSDGVLGLAVDDHLEVIPSARDIDSKGVIIIGVLISKNNPHVLGDLAAHNFNAGCERKILKVKGLVN